MAKQKLKVISASIKRTYLPMMDAVILTTVQLMKIGMADKSIPEDGGEHSLAAN